MSLLDAPPTSAPRTVARIMPGAFLVLAGISHLTFAREDFSTGPGLVLVADDPVAGLRGRRGRPGAALVALGRGRIGVGLLAGVLRRGLPRQHRAVRRPRGRVRPRHRPGTTVRLFFQPVPDLGCCGRPPPGGTAPGGTGPGEIAAAADRCDRWSRCRDPCARRQRPAASCGSARAANRQAGDGRGSLARRCVRWASETTDDERDHRRRARPPDRVRPATCGGAQALARGHPGYRARPLRCSRVLGQGRVGARCRPRPGPDPRPVRRPTSPPLSASSERCRAVPGLTGAPVVIKAFAGGAAPQRGEQGRPERLRPDGLAVPEPGRAHGPRRTERDRRGDVDARVRVDRDDGIPRLVAVGST